jgi:hypothetical protein
MHKCRGSREYIAETGRTHSSIEKKKRKEKGKEERNRI